jgi:diphosphomevalonate decarboxylase
MSSDIEIFSPVNIAWIKYMGKSDPSNNVPSNASLSVTLKNAGTRVSCSVAKAKELQIQFGSASRWLDAAGQQRAIQFLKLNEQRMKTCLDSFGVAIQKNPIELLLETENTIPERAGIASSASSFSAYTLALAAALAESQDQIKELFSTNESFVCELAKISSLGSGSSGRSFFGPFCFWDRERFFPVQVESYADYAHMILLFEDAAKSVSSSQAHLRVPSSKFFGNRARNVARRLESVLPKIRSGQLLDCAPTVAEEAFEMHLLFETSVPPFSYLSFDALTLAKELSVCPEGVLTIDAGTNLHWLVPKTALQQWQKRLEGKPGLKRILVDEIGMGPTWS